jgi:hypothetical protein
VLLLHDLAQDRVHVVPPEMLGVVRPRALYDAPAVREQMGREARVFDPRVLRLDVEDLAPVSNVVVEPE